MVSLWSVYIYNLILCKTVRHGVRFVSVCRVYRFFMCFNKKLCPNFYEKSKLKHEIRSDQSSWNERCQIIISYKKDKRDTENDAIMMAFGHNLGFILEISMTGCFILINPFLAHS